MASRKNTNKAMDDFMHEYFDSLSQEQQAIAYQKLSDIVNMAQEVIVEDAEKAIAKLRVFSLR